MEVNRMQFAIPSIREPHALGASNPGVVRYSLKHFRFHPESEDAKSLRHFRESHFDSYPWSRRAIGCRAEKLVTTKSLAHDK